MLRFDFDVLRALGDVVIYKALLAILVQHPVRLPIRGVRPMAAECVTAVALIRALDKNDFLVWLAHRNLSASDLEDDLATCNEATRAAASEASPDDDEAAVAENVVVDEAGAAAQADDAQIAEAIEVESCELRKKWSHVQQRNAVSSSDALWAFWSAVRGLGGDGFRCYQVCICLITPQRRLVCESALLVNLSLTNLQPTLLFL